MNTHPPDDSSLEYNGTHLTAADLDRALDAEDAESLPLRCHESDCFIPGDEWGTLLPPWNAAAIEGGSE